MHSLFIYFVLFINLSQTLFCFDIITHKIFFYFIDIFDQFLQYALVGFGVNRIIKIIKLFTMSGKSRFGFSCHLFAIRIELMKGSDSFMARMKTSYKLSTLDRFLAWCVRNFLSCLCRHSAASSANTPRGAGEWIIISPACARTL